MKKNHCVVNIEPSNKNILYFQTSGAISQALDESFATIDDQKRNEEVEEVNKREESSDEPITETDEDSSGSRSDNNVINEDLTVQSFDLKPTSLDDDDDDLDFSTIPPEPPSGFKDSGAIQDDSSRDEYDNSTTHNEQITDVKLSAEEPSNKLKVPIQSVSESSGSGLSSSEEDEPVVQSVTRSVLSEPTQREYDEPIQPDTKPIFNKVEYQDSGTELSSSKGETPTQDFFVEEEVYSSGSDSEDPRMVQSGGQPQSLPMPTKSSKLVPVIRGPMQFSIDSYSSRDQKEVPYRKKLVRSESLSGSQYAPEGGLKIAGDNNTIIQKADSFSEQIIEEKIVTRNDERNSSESPEIELDKVIESTPVKSPNLVTKSPKNTLTHVVGSNVPWIVRKTSLEGNRIYPNDDFALNNLRRKQSFGNSGSGQDNVRVARRSSMDVKANSMGNLDKMEFEIKELEISLRSAYDEGKIGCVTTY